MIRYRFASFIGIACLCSLAASSLASAQTEDERIARAEQRFTSYAFAHEFGSGVYDLDGRLLQVYRLPFAWQFREPDERGPGLNLLLPVTLGFADFSPRDVLDTGLPSSIDSLSFVPGIEVEIPLNERWRLLPYARAGFTFADTTDVQAALYGFGGVAEYTLSHDAWQGRYSSELVYSAVHFRSGIRDDDFVRWRNGAVALYGTGHDLGGHEWEIGPFVVLDSYADAPNGPLTGTDAPQVQLEIGILSGVRPGWKIWHVPVPRFGVSYRFAGDLSAWRFVIGGPF